MRAARIAPWAIAVLTALLCTAAIVLDAMSSRSVEPGWISFVFPVVVVMSTAVGVLLATRRRENPIGWLLLANGLVVVLNGLATNYATYGILENPGSLPGARWAVVFNDGGWPLLFAAFTAIAFVFPDGRFASTRWRRIGIATGACFAVMAVLTYFTPGDFDPPFEKIANPLPEIPGAIYWPPFMVASVGMVVGMFAALLAIVTRLRRAAGVERSQLKVLAYAAALIPGAIAAGWIEALAAPGSGVATVTSLALVLAAIPLAVGVAVMRYRLYEIDRVINRTLVYVGLSVLLAATYAAVSVAVGVAVGGGSTVPTATATLAVALAFGALRSRVQMLVDRRFSRDRYEGLSRVHAFLEDLRAGRAAPEDTGRVLAAALRDPRLELFFWLPGVEAHVDAAGHPAEPLPGSGRDVTPVRRGSLMLGAVVHDKALSERPDLLESVIDAAGLAIEIARLRAEVARRLAEVEVSRARIVTAGYEERRRLERDLHDGAQQRLVSIGLSLRNLQGRLPAGSDAVQASLDSTVDQLTDAIEELRELARGVRPAVLDDGLAPALRELAARSPLRTDVEATAERFDERIEAAAYFVASEALTNSVKHARASCAHVRAARENGHLVLSVSDDGVGGAQPSGRSGLDGIADRIAALGGTVSVFSPLGQGTAVTAELPCG